MATTPRTPDDGRNDKQRAAHERDQQAQRNQQELQRGGPGQKEPFVPQRGREQGDDDGRRELLGDNRPHDFIERTRPEDRLPDETARGQITRDNVNPNIPSAENGQGPIVDPNTIGMDQGVTGAPVPEVQEGDVTAPLGSGTAASINEPPGSTIGSLVPPETPPANGITGEAQTPVITSLEPDEATIGEETFDMFVHGTGFDDNSVIVFAGQDEPTDLEDDGTLSTGINMDVWQGADVVKVSVKNGDKVSNEMDFTFHAEAAQRKAPPKADKRKGKGVKAKSKSRR